MIEIKKYRCPFCYFSFKECAKAYHGLCHHQKCNCFLKFKYKSYSIYDCSFPKIAINSLDGKNHYSIIIDFYKETTFLRDFRSLKPNYCILNYIIKPSLIDDKLKIKSLFNNLIFT